MLEVRFEINVGKIVIFIQIIEKNAAAGQYNAVGNALVNIDFNAVAVKIGSAVHISDIRHAFQIIEVRIDNGSPAVQIGKAQAFGSGVIIEIKTERRVADFAGRKCCL